MEAYAAYRGAVQIRSETGGPDLADLKKRLEEATVAAQSAPRIASVQKVADAIAESSPVLSHMPTMTVSGKRTIDVAVNDDERAAAMFKRAYSSCARQSHRAGGGAGR